MSHCETFIVFSRPVFHPRATFQIAKLLISTSPVLTPQTRDCGNQPHSIFSCCRTNTSHEITNPAYISHTRIHQVCMVGSIYRWLTTVKN